MKSLLAAVLFFVISNSLIAGQNTGWRTFDTYVDIRTTGGVPSMACRLQGRYKVGDGMGGDFYWDTTAVARAQTEDSTNYIKIVSSTGVWHRLPYGYKVNVPADSNNVVLTDSSGNIVKMWKDRTILHQGDTSFISTISFVQNYVSSHTLSGTTGSTGPTGTTGVPGVPGLNGNTGTTGATGSNGLVGATGLTGTAGTNGTNGSTGATGLTGAQGLTGPTGVAGITGANGTNGNNGLTGPTGVNGITGPTGSQGAQGVSGIQGITGSQGAQGATGQIGLTGATGLSGITG